MIKPSAYERESPLEPAETEAPEPRVIPFPKRNSQPEPTPPTVPEPPAAA